MSIKDVEWAYKLALPMRETAVLVAVCFKADNGTHQTFVGQQTIAEMTGASLDTVRRSLDVLERKGIITRVRRHGSGGYRTSDLTTVNITTYKADSLQGQEPTRPGAYKADSGHLTSNQPPPTRLTAGAEEIRQYDPSVDPSDTPKPPPPIDRFDDFYAAWPKKVDKPAAQRAWAKAVKRADPDTILTAAAAYRDNPHRPEKQYIRNPATWLNGDGWNDELPGPRTTGKPTPTDRARSVLAAGQQLIASRQGLAPVTTLTPRKEIS